MDSKNKNRNGCGPHFLGTWIPDGPDGVFLPHCNQHDDEYTAGGTKEDRELSDYLLLINCLEEAEMFDGRKRKLARTWAYFYYYMVRLFGWMTFDYKDR